MDLDVGLIFGGLFVGFVVGLTGMGGGALMTRFASDRPQPAGGPAGGPAASGGAPGS